MKAKTNILCFVATVLLSATSCGRIFGSVVWLGPKLVTSDAQTVEFTPDRDCVVELISVYATEYSSKDYDKVLTAEEIAFDGDTAIGKWASVQYDGKKFIVTLTKSECQARMLEIVFDDGGDAGGDIILYQEI